MVEYTGLEVLWYVLICVLWLGYFVLDGYDYGVAMLLRVVGREPYERRMILHSIGPWWDANQVWLIVAGGATFAAFPGWYATLFSGFYLALFLILLGLVLRGVAFEFWGKDDRPGWRSAWEWAAIVGSLLPALLWGVGWASIVGGTPIDARNEFTGNLLDLLKPYALLGGVATATMFLAHGASFLGLRVEGPMVARTRRVAAAVGPIAAAAGIAFLAWTVARGAAAVAVVCAIGAGVLLIGAAALAGRRPAQAFALSSGAIVLFFVTLFADLFPHVMISSTRAAYSPTLHETASGHYTLVVMTVVAGLMLPLVLGYQYWSFLVFRHRLDPDDYAPPPTLRRVIGDAATRGS
jgi:cytochrome d ubiquinol oxidase subunit II